MAMRTVAIMQPTYLPWIGYFDLIDQSDCFVFLDSVQFNKRSWQQRNRIKGPEGILWLTVPVLSKGRRDQIILDVAIDPSASFQEKHIKMITHVYSKAPFFGKYIDELSLIFSRSHKFLADLNVDLIRWLCTQIGIGTQMVTSSSIDVEGKKVRLLVEICEALEADRYLSAEGSRTYIEENNLFGQSGIDLAYQAYHHPQYRQLHGTFEPYLSVLDLLFNEGPSSLAVIRTGRT
jgi:hypothetical protein